MPDPAIALADLHKRYGRREVLCGLDLVVPAGTTYGLVGPNGAGKTTLFRILVGLTPCTSGTAVVLGQPPGAGRADIGYMTQAEALYDDLSVSDNIRFFGKVYGLAGDTLEEAVRSALVLVHLTDRADSPVRSLSGGMRRRASLACAVVHRPRLLLLDEPTVGVDPELRAEFWDAFSAWSEEGRSLVVSTHHLDEAGRCAQLGLLRDGTLIAEGSPAELLERAGASTVEEAFLAFARRRS